MASDPPACNEQESSARREALKLCREMLSGELSYFEGALRLAPIRFRVGVAEDDPDFMRFVVINSDSDHLPPALVRHRWSAEALESLSPEFERTEAWGRTFAAPACRNLLKRFARTKHPYPEIYCDLNARMTQNRYFLDRRGSVDDLAKLGLSLEDAVGRRFTFVMDDANDQGLPDDIMFNGVVVKDKDWGYLAVGDPDGVYWRSELEES